MQKLFIKIVEDKTENFFGVEGYEVELSTKHWTITAFINMKNEVSTDTSVSVAGLFKNTPFASDFVKKCKLAVQKAIKEWNPAITVVNVDI